MGFTISPAAVADYAFFARLFPELGVPEATPSEARFVTSIVPGAIILRDGDAAAGYAWSRVRAERLHVVHVITDPLHRARGVGRALMDALAERGRAAGLRKWLLNVKPENAPALALYRRCGMHVVFASTSMRITWDEVSRLQPSPDATARELAPADDARFEAALGLPRGELDSMRALSRLVFGVERDGPSGACAFDPTFPGAAVFRARSAADARALLDAMRPRALPEHDHVQLFVEDNAALDADLQRAGAHLVMRVLRMEGEL